MAAGAPLIPEGGLGVAALADVFLLLLAFAAFLVCAGTLYAWKHTLGSLIDAIVSLLTIRAFGVHISFGWPLDKLNNAVQHALSLGVQGSEKAIGKFFYALGVIVGWMVNLALFSATTLEHAVSWLIHVYIPGRASWAASVLYPPALIAKIVRAAIAKELPHIGRQAKAVAHGAVTVVYRPVRAFERRLGKDEALLHKIAGGAVAAVGALPSPWAFPRFRRSWRELELWRKVTARRLHRLEALLAASGLALAVANMTGTSLRCWRGQGNIARVLRHVCGFPKWALDLLILGTVEAFIASDLCAFSDLLQKQAKAMVPALMELVDVEDALIDCHGTVKPLVFQLPDADFPPLQGTSPLAA